LRLTTSDYFFQLNLCGYSPYVTSSLTRGWDCRLQLLLTLVSTIILGSESHGIYDHILLPQIRGFPNLEGQVPVFISPRNRVAQLYPQALGSLFVASYDSQGYGGGIRNPPYLQLTANYPFYNPSARTARKTQFLYCYMRVRCRGNLFT
jgi:hypothetical protein